MLLIMRIAKVPHMLHTGIDLHQALTPVFPPLLPPITPNAPWIVLGPPSPTYMIWGKYTDSNVASEYMPNTLFGHDWGLMQIHIPIPPVYALSPSTLTILASSSHKFWLPSYSVKSAASGGVLAKSSGSSTTAVAIALPCGISILQDCMDRGGVGYVAPTGLVNYALVTTHWVGFTGSDLFAGIIAMAADAAAAILWSKLGNSRLGKFSSVTQALMGALAGAVGAAVAGGLSNLMNFLGVPNGVQIAVQVVLGIALIALDVSPTKIDHTAVPGAGLLGGGLADAAGGDSSNPTGESGPRDPFFGKPNPSETNQDSGTTGEPNKGTDGGAPDASVPDATTQGSHNTSPDGGTPNDPSGTGAGAGAGDSPNQSTSTDTPNQSSSTSTPNQSTSTGTPNQSTSDPGGPNQSSNDNQSRNPTGHP